MLWKGDSPSLSLYNSHPPIGTSVIMIFMLQKFRTPHGISICLPGSETPDWFSYQSSGSSLTIQLLQHSCDRRFIGFAYCAVIGSEEVNDGAGYHFGVKCSCDFETRTSCETKYDDRICYLSAATNNMDELIGLDHVLLGFVPCLDVSLPNGDHQTAASFQSLQCKYKKSNWSQSEMLWGVSFIYKFQ